MIDATGTCVWCGTALTKPPSGRIGRFCPRVPGKMSHYDAWYKEQGRLKRLEAREGRTCEARECENPLPPGANAGRRFCDDSKCMGKRKYAAIKNDTDRYEQFKERSKLTQRKKHKDRTPAERAAWSIQRRAREGAKRVREAGGVVEDVDILRDVIIPSGLACAICGGRVALVLGANGRPSPLSVSIDHIVGVGEGGSHTAGNLALAHHGCNGGLKQHRSLEWAMANATRRDAPAPTVAELHSFYGALALTSGGQGILLESLEEPIGDDTA